MIYECDNCEATLGPGMTACPRCGELFDEPVPDDAQWDGPDPVAVAVGVAEPPVSTEAAAPEVVTPPEAVTPPRLRASPRWPRIFAAASLLLGSFWLGFHYWNLPSAPEPVFIPASAPLSDLAAHPQYAANMTALVRKLRETGVGAEWPAFGSDDVLLITPQARAAEPPVTWDVDMDRRLAQGIYGEFAQTRFESGFPDGDTTACSVLVTGATGRVVAVDFMGRVE